jgi:hypothetical protein
LRASFFGIDFVAGSEIRLLANEDMTRKSSFSLAEAFLRDCEPLLRRNTRKLKIRIKRIVNKRQLQELIANWLSGQKRKIL